jgi:ubiquinone/menaquinone biosynthesis C-methylase UbiE
MTNRTSANVDSYRQRVISRVKPFFEGDSLLDAGCGDGEDAVFLLDYFKKIEAVDIAENDNWKKLASDRLIFRTGNAENMNYPVGSFDTVMEKDMLHHAEKPEAAVKEMCRVARKKVIIIEANRYNPIFYLHLTLMGGHQHFNRKRFREIIYSCGMPFEIKTFSARVCPINYKPLITMVNGISDILEKFPLYAPIIEYNFAIITKKQA